MSNALLPELQFKAGSHGWSAELPNAPRLFGRVVSLVIDTRMTPTEPRVLPEISKSQASLVRLLLPALPKLVPLVEEELKGYNQEHDPEFQGFLSHPHLWLDSEGDGKKWAFVVGRTDNPDFGYHADFSGLDFVELWAAD